jgi:Protein of unknown function (DUF3300)
MATRQPLGAGELEQLVAPIALYPDPLVAQVLAASTYPQQVQEADGWRQGHAYARPEEIAADADVQPWDPSVKALTAFPQVLAQLDRSLQWTTDLGNAYYNQPQDVLEAVQVMRRRAQAAGYLRSTPQETVRYDSGVVQVLPADPQVVYVPAYNPWAVYGEPVAPYPGFSLLSEIGQFLGSSVLRYGLGIGLSAFTRPWGWLAWGLDWLGHALLFNNSAYYSHSATVANWGFPRRGFYAYSGRGGFGRGHDLARGWGNERRGNIWGNESWRHGGYDAGGWHSSTRGSEGRAANWNHDSNRGFEAFHGDRGSVARSDHGSFGSGHGSFNRMPENRIAQRSPFNEGAMNRSERASIGGFQRNEFGGRSSGFASASLGKSHGGSHLFGGGGSAKSFSGGHSSHFGGGHAPKAFGGKSSFHGAKSFGGGKGFKGGKGFGGGKSFGGGHSHGGGHSGGHGGGGSKHYR